MKTACRLSGLGGKSPSVWVHHRLQQWVPFFNRLGLGGCISKTAGCSDALGKGIDRHARRPSASSVGFIMLLANMAVGGRCKGRLPGDRDRQAVLELLEALVDLAIGGDSHHINVFMGSDFQWAPPAPTVGTWPIILPCENKAINLRSVEDCAREGCRPARSLMRMLDNRVSQGSRVDYAEIYVLDLLELCLMNQKTFGHIAVQLTISIGLWLDQALAPRDVPICNMPTAGKNWCLKELSQDDKRMAVLRESEMLQYWAGGREASAEFSLLPVSICHDGTRVGGRAIQGMTVVHPTNVAYVAPVVEPQGGGGGAPWGNRHGNRVFLGARSACPLAPAVATPSVGPRFCRNP